MLTREECAQADPEVQEDSIDYAKLYEERYPLLRLAYERSDISKNADFVRFCQENDWWLSDYALFMAVKARFGGKAWTKWAQDIRLRWGNAWTTTGESCILTLNFTNISSSPSLSSGAG